MDATIVSVTVRDGRTKIAVVLTRADAVALTVTGASLAGIGAAIVIGTPLVATAAAAGGTLAVAAAVLATLGWSGGGTWLGTRAFWKRVARKWPRRATALGAQLVDAAQRAIAPARKDSE